MVGETGVGKTLLVKTLLADLGRNTGFSPCIITDPGGDATTFLSQLLKSFPPPKQIEDTLRAMWAGVDKTRSAGQQPIVVVDDAHLLSNDGAAILGKLATGDRARTLPVPVLLAGQPTTVRRLNLPAFRLLKGASGVSIDLYPIKPDEVAPYINSRLQKAGAAADQVIFQPDTYPMIAEATGGVPRQINKLCEVCLFLAGESKAASITAESLTQTLDIYDDMEVPGLDDGPSKLSTQPDVIVLQEPKRPHGNALEPAREVASAPVSPSGPRRGSRAIVPPPKKRRGTWYAAAGLMTVGAAYLLSPISPLPADNPVMVALYGESAAADPDEAVVTAASGGEAVQPAPTSEPTVSALPALQRIYDPATDPADPYYEVAIASTSSQEITIAYSRAAIRGHRRSALYLGQLFETGDGVAFAPDVAAQWYAVADDAAVLNKTAASDELSDDGPVQPLFSTVEGTMAEFVWQGDAAMFRLEVGDRDGNAVAQFTTPLTAALVEVPPNAAQWRVKTSADSASDWIAIGGKRSE